MDNLRSDDLVNEVVAARALGVSVSLLQKSRTKSSSAIEHGECPSFIKMSGKVFYSWAVLQSFVQSLQEYDAKASTTRLPQDGYNSADDVKQCDWLERKGW